MDKKKLEKRLLEREKRDKMIDEIGSDPCITGITIGRTMRVFNSCSNELVDIIEEQADSNDRLGNKVVLLNIVLTLATIVLALFAGAEFYYKFFQPGG